jgi:hypothetical protein
MKAKPALQEECAIPARGVANPCDAAVPPRTSSPAPAFPGATADQELSEQDVDRVLASSASEAACRAPEDADDEYDGGRESDYPHILFGRARGTRIEAPRAEDGGLHDDDALRVAGGVLVGLVVACSLWSVAALVLIAL